MFFLAENLLAEGLGVGRSGHISITGGLVGASGELELVPEGGPPSGRHHYTHIQIYKFVPDPRRVQRGKNRYGWAE